MERRSCIWAPAGCQNKHRTCRLPEHALAIRWSVANPAGTVPAKLRSPVQDVPCQQWGHLHGQKWRHFTNDDQLSHPAAAEQQPADEPPAAPEIATDRNHHVAILDLDIAEIWTVWRAQRCLSERCRYLEILEKAEMKPTEDIMKKVGNFLQYQCYRTMNKNGKTWIINFSLNY